MITTSLIKTALTLAGKIISPLIFLLTILASYAGYINPLLWATPSVLVLVFPYVSILTIIVTAIWALRRKIMMTAMGVITIVICLPAIGQIFPLHFPKKAEAGEKTFTLMTWNVLHTDYQETPDCGYNRAVNYILKSGADIVCLQELYTLDGRDLRYYTPAMGDSIKAVYPYSASTTKVSDVKVLSKYPVKILTDSRTDHEGRTRRFFLFEVNIDGRPLTLCVTHLMSYSLTTEDREILQHIRGVKSAKESTQKFKASVYAKLKAAFRLRAENAIALREATEGIGGPLIVCGDFNDVAGSWAYRTIRGDDFKDAFTATAFWPTFTYNAHLFYFHIDHILYRGPIEALNWKRGDIRSSDHYPQTATFAFREN